MRHILRPWFSAGLTALVTLALCPASAAISVPASHCPPNTI